MTCVDQTSGVHAARRQRRHVAVEHARHDRQRVRRLERMDAARGTWYISTPNAKTSARASIGSPLICSGAMYAGVPITRSRLRDERDRRARRGDRHTARPKSRIFSRPSAVRMTFSGFRSRCTMPAACALGERRARARAPSPASRRRRPPARRDLFAQRAAVDELGRDEQLAVDLLERVHRADARMRQAPRPRALRAAGVRAGADRAPDAAASAFSATRRPSRASVARYTRPIPPRPSSRTIV